MHVVGNEVNNKESKLKTGTRTTKQSPGYHDGQQTTLLVIVMTRVEVSREKAIKKRRQVLTVPTDDRIASDGTMGNGKIT